MRTFFLLLLLSLSPAAKAQSIDQFFKETFEENLKLDPEFASGAGRYEYDDRWTDWSKAGREQRRQFLERRLAKLKTLTGANELTGRLVQYDFQSKLDSWDLQTHLLIVNQLFGFHNRVYLAIDRMPARTVHDYENILSRLKAVSVYVDQNIGILDEAIAEGLTQSRLVAGIVTKQMEAQMTQTADQSSLLKAFRAFPSNIPAAEQQRLRTAAYDAYDKQFVPAWRKLHGYMANTYTDHARQSDSLGSLPGGRDKYAILIRLLTTTTMSADEIHALGEREVARIEGEMQAVMKEAGFNGTIAEFQKKLNDSPDQHFQSREEMLAYCRNIAKLIEPELPNQFRHIPALLYGIRAIPPEREAATATNAQAPSPDYSTPGWMNLNAYEPQKQIRYDKEALVLHEAVPGHVFQGSVSVGQKTLPDIRKFYHNSAFAEGWALYAESLGASLGMYRDPLSRFGRLSSERFRAVRLVVDTGLHNSGWTRAHALEYFAQHAPEETSAEIDRYIAWPAQALSYKLGELRIKSLRAKAEQALGPKFDIRDFNDAVIAGGVLPLDLLTEQIDGFVAAAAK